MPQVVGALGVVGNEEDGVLVGHVHADARALERSRVRELLIDDVPVRVVESNAAEVERT